MAEQVKPKFAEERQMNYRITPFTEQDSEFLDERIGEFNLAQ